jgi:hypothetical protein
LVDETSAMKTRAIPIFFMVIILKFCGKLNLSCTNFKKFN